MSDKYGPNTKQVEAFLALLPTLTDEQWEVVRDAALDRRAAWDSEKAVWDAVYDASLPWSAARHAAWRAAWDSVYAVRSVGDAGCAAFAALALAVRDRISPVDFHILTAPFRRAGIDFNKLTPTQTPAPDQPSSFSPASGAGSQQVDRENQDPPSPGVDPAGTPAPSVPVQRSLTPGTPSPTPSPHSLGVGDGTEGETVECIYCDHTITAPNAIEGYQRMSSHYDVEHRFAVDDARWVG